MRHLIWRYFWTINFLTIAICAFFAAKAVGNLILSQLPVVHQKHSPPPRIKTKPRHRDIKPIISRNIFCSTCKVRQEKEAAAIEKVVSNDPVPAPSNLKLIATLISKKDPKWTFALITNTTEKNTDLYTLGNQMPRGAAITEISSTKVLFRNGDQLEFLELDKGSSRRAPRKRHQRKRKRAGIPRPTSRMRELAKSIRRAGPNKWEMQRSALNKVLSNTTLIARSARIAPSVKNGKPNGFKLLRVRKGSFYSLLGMFNGDIVHAVNGHPITTPDKALEVYTKLRTASHVTLSLTRRGKPLTHEYVIR
jgi:general secretion pathway protein C